MSAKAIKIANKYQIPLTASFHMQAENLTSYLKLQKVKPVNTFVYKFIYNKIYSKVNAIHFPTRFIKNTFERNIRRKTNAYVISNGVNSAIEKKFVEKPEHLKDKFVILSTGRYCDEKAQDILIKAVGLSKYKDKIHLILAGQGLKQKTFERIAKRAGVSPQYAFFSRKEIVDTINFCDLYVHPARVELEGIACLEAICAGKATIVSNSKKAATSGFAIDPRCIFKNNDPQDLAEKIDFFIENDDIRKEIADKYYASATNYDQAECMNKMEQMLFETIEKYKLKRQKQQ